MKNQWHSYRELLANRDFLLYISTYYTSNFGAQMTMFAIWSQVTLLTGNSPVAISLVTILNTLPGILIAPWSGLLTDRMSKRTILIACYLLRAAVVALMFCSTSLWQLYLLAALHAMFGTFNDPPHRALLPLLVKPEQYVTMNAFNATLNNILQFFRPATAGFVVATFGYKTGFAIDFFMYFVPAIALLFIRVVDQAAERSKALHAEHGMWQELRDGVVYIRTEPILVYLFIFLMLFSLAMGMQGPLVMIFVGQYLAPDAEASKITGFLFSAIGVGGIVGAFLTPRLLRKLPTLWLLFASLAFDGLVVLVFSQAKTVAVSLACFSLLGIITSVNSIVQDTLIQTIVPEHMRGRVYGAFGPITGPLNLISMGAGSSLAAIIGTRAVFFIAGLLEIATVVICRLLPLYRSVRLSLAEKMAPVAKTK